MSQTSYDWSAAGNIVWKVQITHDTCLPTFSHPQGGVSLSKRVRLGIEVGDFQRDAINRRHFHDRMELR